MYGKGTAIGDGGKYAASNPNDPDGAEVTPNIAGLTPNGKIEYYDPDADMETADPDRIVYGSFVPPQDEEKPPVDEEKPPVDEEKPPVDEEKPDQPSQSAEAVYSAPLYRVIDQDGEDIPYKAEQSSGVLTITVDADIASLTGKLGGIQTLKARGIDTIVFVTNGATSTFALSDLLAQTGDTYTLTHDGSTVTFTLNNGSDVSAILQ